MPAAGLMDRRITIQSASVANDGYGEPVKTWADIATVATVWAQVKPMRGSERFEAAQVNPQVDTRFIVRWRGDLDTDMRVVYDGEQYDIVALLELGRREGLEIHAKLFKP